MFNRPGRELFYDPTLGLLERWYCRLLGVPIVGLRIRLRRIRQLLPDQANNVLDAGCGRGVITRMLATRYPKAQVEGLDQDKLRQDANAVVAARTGLTNCIFREGDLTELDEEARYDLIVSVDNLEHIADDQAVMRRLFRALRPEGVLVVHVPHYYRRWPFFRWSKNFNVPGHIRPGYHLPELVERLRRVGFEIERTGFSYGFLENLANNLGYFITQAEERNRILYAALFPFLNAIAWLGQWSEPAMGAGVWVVARRPAAG